MGQIEGLERLIKEKEILDHKLSSASVVFKNIETPGWINQRNPNATNLRLDITPSLAKAENLDRVGNIKQQLHEVVLPAYRMGIGQLNFKISASEVISQTEQSNKIESFTSYESAVLGALIESRNKTLIQLNGHGSFVFELDPEGLEICQRLKQKPIHEGEGFIITGGNVEDLMEVRGRVLERLGRMLNDEKIDNIIDSQEDKDVEDVLIWLFIENENRFLGLLPDFLNAHLDHVTQYQAREGYQLEEVQNVWHPSGEILSKAVGVIKQESAPIRKPKQAESADISVKTAEEATNEQKNLEEIVDEEVIISTPTIIIVPPYQEFPQKPKVLDIERRDPQVREKIDQYLREVLSKDSLRNGEVNQSQVNREFQRLKSTTVDKMEENGYIKPSGGNQRFPLFDITAIVQMLYYVDHGSHNLNANNFRKESEQIILEELEKIKEAEKSKDSNGNGNGKH